MYLKHIFHIASFNCKNQLTVFRRTDLFKLFHSEMKPAHNKQAYGPIGYQHTILRTISTFFANENLRKSSHIQAVHLSI